VAGVDVFNIVVTGVGGQGQLTLARILAEAALRQGMGALVAETHGLSQRGGTVVVHVRLGAAEAPLIPPGTADLLLAMELIEAARQSRFLRSGAAAVVNDYVVEPPLPGVEAPPREKLLGIVSSRAGRLLVVEATKEALRLGEPRAANMVLLGAALGAGLLPLERGSVEEAVKAVLGAAAGVNLEALGRGASLARRGADGSGGADKGEG
jgi:indolepyruvate ferredoxin oxidoreductase beta subunit